MPLCLQQAFGKEPTVGTGHGLWNQHPRWTLRLFPTLKRTPVPAFSGVQVPLGRSGEAAFLVWDMRLQACAPVTFPPGCRAHGHAHSNHHTHPGVQTATGSADGGAPSGEAQPLPTASWPRAAPFRGLSSAHFPVGLSSPYDTDFRSP